MITFHLHEMTFLRYFMPLILHARKRGIKCQVVLSSHEKYNSPCKHLETIEEVVKPFADIVKKAKRGSVHVCMEGLMPPDIEGPSYSLSYMTDFIKLAPKYQARISHVVLPSPYFGEMLEEIPDNVIYLGSPKYDIPIDGTMWRAQRVSTKDKIALLIHHQKAEEAVTKRANELIDEGWVVYIKGRAKFPVSKSRLDERVHIEYDYDWYPHDTMVGMQGADLVVNFDSTAVKEACMMEIMHKFENVEAKDRRHLTELYEEGAKEKYLWSFNSSEAILDHVEENHLCR